MSGHSDADAAAGSGLVPDRSSELSRRSLLRGAAGAGAVGLAAATGAGAVIAAARSEAKAAPAARDSGDARAAGDAQAAGDPGDARDPRDAGDPRDAAHASADSLVVYLRDATTGEMEGFVGTSQVRFRDPALAARLRRQFS